MKRQYNIRSAMIASVSTLTLLPMMIAVIISLVMFHHETTLRIRQENLKVAHTVASAVELFASRPVVMLKQVRDEVNEDSDPSLSNLTEIANSTLDSDPIFESLLFIDAKGDLVGVAGENLKPIKKGIQRQNYSETPLFKRIQRGRSTVWSEPFVSLKTGETVISVAIPWRNGMISGNMNLSYLCKLVEPTKTSQNAYAFIVSREGRLIAHPDRALVGEKEAFISIPQITAGFKGTTGTYNFRILSREVIGSVLPFSQNDWVIVSVQDKEKAYASLYKMELLLGALTVLVIACALFYSYRRVDSITAPILTLSDSTRRIAAGEQFTDSFTSAYKEIHELYGSFKTMSDAVAQRERDLQERNEELAMTEEELRGQVEEYLKTYDALVSEKVKLESVLASMGEGLSIMGTDFQVILQNKAHLELIGDSTGKYCYNAFDHNSSVCPGCPLKLAYEDGCTHTALRSVQRDGKEIFLEISASPMRNAFGEISGGIEVVRDVTSRVVADHEIRRLNQELETRVIERTADLELANRELESFSYSVSHDLRAPLRHINSFSSILKSEYSDKLDDDAKYYISRIIAGCSKMGNLIDDLLELSQVTRSELRKESVNLSRIVSMIAATLVEREPERHVNFKIEDGLSVTGDERLLEVMLNNLLSNAWKYSSLKEESSIEFGCSTFAARPVFFVKDNGAGFDMSYSDKLFAPFQRLHGVEFEGTGVGLAIVQRIVHRHGGNVWAEAAVDDGATFYFTLKS